MRILLAMSGGVDSSYVAYSLAKAGADVHGVYMKLHDRKNYHEKNIANVSKVASELGFSYEVLDLSKQFNQAVYEPFLNTYKQGQTPNPCALCNRFIKLGELLNLAKSQNRTLYTGHYANKRLINKHFRICKAKDIKKDQSYFLAGVDPKALEFVEFPLGEVIKSELKAKALQIPLLKAISEQKESSEICFVSSDYAEVLAQHFQTNMPGLVKDLNGNVVGEHKGYMHYTIGKRRGFSVNGASTPHFVVRIDAQNNELYVGEKEDLLCKQFWLSNLNLFDECPEIIQASVKIRYNSSEIECELNTKSLEVNLKQGAYALASGQLAVFYDNDSVIASGFIK